MFGDKGYADHTVGHTGKMFGDKIYVGNVWETPGKGVENSG